MLAVKEFARMEEAQNSLVDLVRTRLRADAPDRRDDASLGDEARMTVSLGFGIAHYLMRDWITGGFPADADEILRQAVDLACRVAAA